MNGVVLINPKYAHNVGGAIRACAAFGVPQLRWTGDRVLVETYNGRLPREERMREYNAAVTWSRAQRPLDELAGTPIAVELHQGAELLTSFKHPDDAIYVFGPEDGSVPKALRVRCHRFVVIPTHHCLNLAAAVNIVLYDRRIKTLGDGATMHDLLRESRGHLWEDDD